MSKLYEKLQMRKCFKNGTPDSEIFETVFYRTREQVVAIRWVTTSIRLVVSLLAAIVTVIFIITVVKAIRYHQVSRKCYILILTRSFGDLLIAFCLLLHSILRFGFNTNITADQEKILDTLTIINNAALWSEMLSYNLLSGIKLYAVAKPLHYRNTFTIKRCLYLSSLSGIIFILILSTDMIMAFRSKGSARIYYQIQSGVQIVIYSFTLIFFIFTAIFVFRASKFSDGRSRKSKFPFSKFAVMFGVFIFFYSFLIANDIFFTFIFENLSFCFQLLHDVPLTVIQEIVWILFLFRILIDPIINCCIDKKIKASMKSLFPSLPICDKCWKTNHENSKPLAQTVRTFKDCFHISMP